MRAWLHPAAASRHGLNLVRAPSLAHLCSAKKQPYIASMGIYVCKASTLQDLLEKKFRCGGEACGVSLDSGAATHVCSVGICIMLAGDGVQMGLR